MKINYVVYLALTLVVFSCNSTKTIVDHQDDDIIKIYANEIENSSVYINAATKSVDSVIKTNTHVPFEKLQDDIAKNAGANSGVKITHSNHKKKSGNQIYHELQNSTMYIGSSYLCNKCPNVHLSAATGFVIHEDGIVVTNHHVVRPKEDVKHYGIFAIDHEGNVYNVTEVLSASKADDLAILKIETNGEKLPALPLAQTELVGEDVYMMGHPFRNTFLMTKGIISRKYGNSNKSSRISITAEFGQGASGGPVVNDSGEVVGVVSATRAYYSNNSKEKGDMQLMVRVVVPVSQLDNYLNVSKI
ncbi:MAG: serine protease [Polaribacter sp.]|uniref:S1 family peptidase n=1 Tax=Polaribacter sp. TaxID=1920175 RepID=UPI0032634659